MKNNKEIVKSFIESVWNLRQLERIDDFVSGNYRDFSFLPAIPPTRDGLRTWIENTTSAFDHHTTIESMIAEGDQVAVRISFKVKHIGTKRGIDPTGRTTTIKGFRLFMLEGEKISQHWALIDGEALQTALTDQYHGCEIPT
jgi:predicted ester cyclase